MSGLWGIHPAAAAAGAAAVGGGVTHAYHSSGASRPRRRSNQATFVVERGRDKSARAKRLVSSDAADADAVSETAASGARAIATTATFPVASRAHVRGVLYDADGEPVVIDPRARFGAKALFLSSLASSALAVAVTRALAARDARHDESTHDVASEASHDLEGIARGIAAAAAADAAGAGPSGRDVSSLPNRSTNPRDGPRDAAAESAPRAKASDAVAESASHERGHSDAAPDTAPLTRELRALMEASPCQSPLDSDLDAEGDWMGSVVSSASPFATPARQALGALRDTQRAAAQAGAPFAEEAVREMERIVARAARSAAASASASACASGAATPLSRTRPALPRPHAAPRVQALVSALEKRDVSDVISAATAEERLSEAETRRAGARKQDAPAPETPSPAAAPAPKLPSRARSSSASPRDEPLPLDAEREKRQQEREREDERARSASEATDAARDRVRVAEERFRVARERLAEASSAASRSRASSAMPTPRGGAEELRDAAAPRVSPRGGDENENANENENESAPSRKADAASEVREMAEKARAALARSRLASERVAAAAERAARDADAEASRVREEWARRLERSPRATPGEAGNTQENTRELAVPADRWASSDEVRGKTDVLDRFMGALADARAEKSAAEKRGADERDDGGGGAREEARDAPFGSAAVARETSEISAAASAAKPATSLGVLSVSLLGDPREGETLTLRVDAAALPPDCGPVTLRWQRGAPPSLNAGGSNPASPRVPGASAPPAFKTILGARRASYTLTKADVGCVVRAVAAAGDANAGGNVFGSAETRGAVAAREW